MIIHSFAGKKIYHFLVPDVAKTRIERAKNRRIMVLLKLFFKLQEIIFRKHMNKLMFDDTRKAGILGVFSLLKEKGYDVYPEMDSLIHEKYSARKLEIKKDPNTRLFYVSINGKKLFYKRGMRKSSINYAFNTVSFEQDYASPHRYFTNEHYFVGVIQPDVKQVNCSEKGFGVSGGVVVDVGVAEGNFALSAVETASRVYIVEGDAGWCEALRQTFLPYKDKVVIIQKYLSNISDENNITLVDLVRQYNITTIDFLKMDVEGYERQALQGGLVSGVGFVDVDKMAICVYHNPEDEKEISNFVTQQGYTCYLTDGYSVVADYKQPIIRKVVLRAYKKMETQQCCQ